MADTDGNLLGREFIAAVVFFHDAVGRLLGVSAVERKTLDVLDRLGPCGNVEIARHTGLTTGAVTGLVDRLEKRGYVIRTPDPSDRRRIVVALADHPVREAVTERVFGALGADMAELVSTYGPEQLATIADFQRRTTDILTRHTRAISTEQESET